jgi:hypothetical protein
MLCPWRRPHRPLVGEEEVEMQGMGDIEAGEAGDSKLDVSGS